MTKAALRFPDNIPVILVSLGTSTNRAGPEKASNTIKSNTID